MKIRKFLKCVLISLILIAFCLSIAAFAKANTAQTVTQTNEMEFTEEDKYNIENYVSKYRNMDSYEVIPYTKDGERRYLLIGERLGDYYIIVCAVRNNSLVVLTKGNDRR